MQFLQLLSCFFIFNGLFLDRFFEHIEKIISSNCFLRNLLFLFCIIEFIFKIIRRKYFISFFLLIFIFIYLYHPIELLKISFLPLIIFLHVFNLVILNNIFYFLFFLSSFSIIVNSLAKISIFNTHRRSFVLDQRRLINRNIWTADT